MTALERRVHHEQGSTGERDAARKALARVCVRRGGDAEDLAEMMGALGLLGDDTVETLLAIGRVRQARQRIRDGAEAIVAELECNGETGR